MKIAILGSGGREHALAVQISKSKKLDKIYVSSVNEAKKILKNKSI